MSYDELVKGLRHYFDDVPLVLQAADAIDGLQKELKQAVNELCLYCEQYKQRHNGACDDCRWYKPPKEEEA